MDWIIDINRGVLILLVVIMVFSIEENIQIFVDA